MCGFAGVVQIGGGAEELLAERMGWSLKHRGPDQGGLYVNGEAPHGVALASRRLAILDLSHAGDQPMRSADGTCCIAYNGELYNEPEMRRELEDGGFRYRSQGDTETVLHAYEAHGPAAFARLNGMFALAVVDRRRDLIVLARDRMGIKPLYYAWNGSRLLFASELRTLVHQGGLAASIDRTALDLFLTLGYVPAPYSLVQGINKLSPGTYLTLDAHGTLAIHEYWRPAYDPEPPSVSRRDAELIVHDTVLDAVRRQMRSDVPVGLLLSGGVDSTIVAAGASATTDLPIATFTVRFESKTSRIDPAFNADAEYARRVSAVLGTVHHDMVVGDGAELSDMIRVLSIGLDEPVWEASFVSIYAISKMARQHGVKVLMTGDGSDELFAGYPWHGAAWRQEQYQRIPGLSTAASLVARIAPRRTVMRTHARNLRAVLGLSDVARYEWLHAVFSPAERQALIASEGARADDALVSLLSRLLEGANGRGLPDRIALLDLALWVREHFNQRLDRMTMLNSVEARVPFQDNEVVALALSLPYDLKAPRGRAKHLLKEAFRGSVPDFVLDRPKRPFATPMRAWAIGGLRPLIQDTLSPDGVRSVGLVEPEMAQRVLAAAETSADERSMSRLWALLTLHLWADGLRKAPTD